MVKFFTHDLLHRAREYMIICYAVLSPTKNQEPMHLGSIRYYFYQSKKLVTDMQMFWRYILRLAIPSLLNFPLFTGYVLGVATTFPQLRQRKGISTSLNFCFGLRALKTCFSSISSTKADLLILTSKKRKI